MNVEIRTAPFDPWQELSRRTPGAGGRCGATAVFVGTMRDFNEGVSVREMFLEHYPGMTEKHLETIVAEAVARWELLDALIIHRVGQIRPDETIVLEHTRRLNTAYYVAGLIVTSSVALGPAAPLSTNCEFRFLLRDIAVMCHYNAVDICHLLYQS